MSFEFSDEDFKLFLEEGRAHLQTLEQNLLVLEDNLEAPLDLALINEMFRAAHSVKGAAGMLGLKTIQSLTHQLENLLGRMREGKIGADLELLEGLFEAVDVLGTLMVEMSGESRETRTDTAPTIQRLKDLLEARENIQTSDDAETLLPFQLAPELEASLDAKAMEAAKRAIREKRYLYEVKLDLEGCRWVEESIDHDIFQKLAAISEVVALHSDPAPPAQGSSEPFPLKGHALVQSSADPMILSILVPMGPDELRLVYDPANPPEAAAPAKPAAPKAAPQEAAAAVPQASEAPKPAARQAAKAGGAAGGHSQSIRVDVERLDDLMNVVGEIVIGNTRLSQLGGILEGRYDRDVTVQQLAESLGQLGRLVGDLQMTVIRTRMVPVERVFSRFPRLIRDLARNLGKEAKLEMSGQETEIDKTVSEELEDPLVHLLRNAIDHGVESPEKREAAGKSRVGTIKLSAHHEGNHIVIVLEDDGGGIDPAKILKKARDLGLANPDTVYSDHDAVQFIFAPGFSTAEKVTDVSGRGVGMDVVNQNIRKLKGSIHVVTTKGEGSKFIIKLPLTLAITKALLVRAGGETFAIPLESVRESIRLAPSAIKTINGKPVTQVRNEVLPLFRLQEAFGFGSDAQEARHLPVVVVGGDKKQLGLIVDRLEGEQDIVVKSMGNYLGDIRGVAGATILGDGRVALILDVATLIDESESAELATLGAG
ncbi:chemotaxis protein CheA [bacterium]|nr:chemotaxis protein CheA [bacterium]